MACVIYKGTEKLLIDPRGLQHMLKQGWSVKPPEETQYENATAEDFVNLMRTHEEMKRISDAAISERNELIEQLSATNHELSQDMEDLEGEVITVREQLATVLADLQKYRNAEEAAAVANKEPGPPAADNENEVDEKQLTGSKVAHLPYGDMKVQQLREHAKRAKISGWENLKKLELIEALQDLELRNVSNSENQG